MKAKLQEKYIPSSYKSHLFSTMINLKQMILSVTEYYAKFKEARLTVSSMLRITFLSALILLMA